MMWSAVPRFPFSVFFFLAGAPQKNPLPHTLTIDPRHSALLVCLVGYQLSHPTAFMVTGGVLSIPMQTNDDHMSGGM